MTYKTYLAPGMTSSEKKAKNPLNKYPAFFEKGIGGSGEREKYTGADVSAFT